MGIKPQSFMSNQGRNHLNLYFLRFSEKYLEFPKKNAIFVPQNNKDSGLDYFGE